MANSNNPEEIKPYDASAAKGEQVEHMFDSIAESYDFMNAAMTLGMHHHWRHKALDMLAPALPRGARLLDVACGTGDVTIDLAHHFPTATVRGLDLSEGMLAVARRRIAKLPGHESERIEFTHGDCLSLPWEDDTFDAVTVAYGVRNFERLEQGYKEMLRVLKPGGSLLVIELCEPRGALLRMGYKLYTRTLVPMVGRMVSGDTQAYSYLPRSIAACPQREQMTELMKKAGFPRATHRVLFPGVIAIYQAWK